MNDIDLHNPNALFNMGVASQADDIRLLWGRVPESAIRTKHRYCGFEAGKVGGCWLTAKSECWGGRMQGWELVCWGVLGFPYLKIKKFRGFLVFSLPVSKKYQSANSCFLEDIDLTSTPYNLLDEPTLFFGAPPFRQIPTFANSEFSNSQKYYFRTCSRIFLICLRSPRVSKDKKIVGFWGHVPKSRNHRNEEFRVLP